MIRRILVVSHGAALGGSPISALNIARQIDPNRFGIVFAFGEDGPVAELARKDGWPVEIVDRKGFIGISSIRRFREIVRRHQIDVVHLNTLTSYYKYPAFAAWISRKPIAWFVRENPEEKRCLRLGRYVRAFARKVVTVSYDTAAHMHYIPKKKLMTIHNGVDLDAYYPLPAEAGFARLQLEPARYITTICSLEPRKGVLDLIDAYALARPKDCRLLIVGADRTRERRYERLLKQRVSELGLDTHVIFFGESSDILHVMAASYCLVLASYWEGLSRVLLEGMACGKAILSSSNGGNKEQVLDGINGFTFSAGDVTTLAALMKKVEDGDLVRSQGLASRKLAEERFSIRRTNQALEQLYDSLQ